MIHRNLFSALFLFFICCGGLVGCGVQNPDLRTLQLNYLGNKALVATNYQGAMDNYLEAFQYDPFIPSLHLNLGLSFEGLQQAEKALPSYRQAEKLAEKEKDPKLVFFARFNQAQLLGKAKKVDEALGVYQKALEIDPTSKEVKTNIELLIQSQQTKSGGDKSQDQDQKGNQSQDQKDQQGQKQDQKKDEKQDKQDKQGEGQKEEKKDQQFQQSAKYQPRPFKGEELSEGDVKKILGELKQQEEKIRAEYNRKEMKEQPRDKDW